MVVGFRLVLVDVGWIVLGRASDMEAARLARLAKGLGKFLCPVRFVQEWTEVVWMADCAPGAGLALHWCQ